MLLSHGDDNSHFAAHAENSGDEKDPRPLFLVPEVPATREHHRQAMFIRGGDHFRILH